MAIVQQHYRSENSTAQHSIANLLLPPRQNPNQVSHAHDFVHAINTRFNPLVELFPSGHLAPDFGQQKHIIDQALHQLRIRVRLALCSSDRVFAQLHSIDFDLKLVGFLARL